MAKLIETFKIDTLSELEDAVEAAIALAGSRGAGADVVNIEPPITMELAEKTLTDGSKVYDVVFTPRTL